MRILNPRFLNSGYNAWFAAFALIGVCLPLLFATIGAAMVPHESWWAYFWHWAFVSVPILGTRFLATEFWVQFRFWLRKRRGTADGGNDWLNPVTRGTGREQAARSSGDKPAN
jgi:hypothetical protein